VLPVLALTLPGPFAYAVASAAALQGSAGIAEEVNGGTLEQAHLSPAPPSLLVLGRLTAVAVEGLIPAILLTLVFGLGYGRVAGIGAVVHVFNMAVGFFGGMFIPIALFPHGVEIFARFLPTALGTEALNTTLAGGGLGATWSDGTLPWLLVHVVVLGALAWAAYVRTVRRARRERSVRSDGTSKMKPCAHRRRYPRHRSAAGLRPGYARSIRGRWQAHAARSLLCLPGCDAREPWRAWPWSSGTKSVRADARESGLPCSR